MKAFATNKRPSLTFKGVCYDNVERPEIILHLPQTDDIQRERFYWEDTLTGSCFCMSLIELRDASDDMMAPHGGEDAFRAIADQFRYDIIGIPATKADELAFGKYRNGNLGPLKERHWENDDIRFVQPHKEGEPCWFVTNAGILDQDQEPKFLLR